MRGSKHVKFKNLLPSHKKGTASLTQKPVRYLLFIEIISVYFEVCTNKQMHAEKKITDILNSKAVGVRRNHFLEQINISYIYKYPATIADTSILVRSLRTGNCTEVL
jgi:hypothetical protein